MLKLEKDFRLTAEDFPIMRTPFNHDPEDLAAYLDFLEAVEAFESKKAEATLYTDEFRL